jgi:(R,R)-butanediol dehydrogenase/meso-butanediol dehydrogenase/diacetyl reductase
VAEGSRVLIQGFGPIGAGVLLAARAHGAAEIFVSEPSTARREHAARLDATEVYDPTTCSVRTEVYRRTDRVGPDVVFECTGLPAVLEDSVSSVRKGGKVVLVGIGHDKAALSSHSLVPYERQIIGSIGYRGDLPKVVDLIATGQLDPRPLITSVVGLEEAITGAFKPLAAGSATEMKILIDVRSA